MKIDLDDANLKKLVSEAILASLTDEKRSALIQGALQYLLAPGEKMNGYGRAITPSPIEEAFNLAINGVAHTVANEMLRNDPMVKNEIKKLITKAVEKMANSDEAVEKVRDAIVNTISGYR